MTLRSLVGIVFALAVLTGATAAPATFEGTVQLKATGRTRMAQSLTFQTRADRRSGIAAAAKS